MALPTVQELKDYLRITTSDEDAVIASLRASAIANVEAYIDLPIEARELTWVDEGTDGKSVYSLIFPYYPIDEAEDLTIEDSDGNLVDPAAYRVDLRTGMIRRTKGHVFANGPYTITAVAGWSAHPDYADLIEPAFRQAIIDIAAEMYAQRNPAASTDAVGSGIMTVHGLRKTPPRVERILTPFRRVWVG